MAKPLASVLRTSRGLMGPPSAARDPPGILHGQENVGGAAAVGWGDRVVSGRLSSEAGVGVELAADARGEAQGWASAAEGVMLGVWAWGGDFAENW